MAAMPMFMVLYFKGEIIIVSSRNVKPNNTAPKVKVTFHPRPLILVNHIRFSAITGLFELTYGVQYYSVRKSNINMILVLGHVMVMTTLPIYGKTKHP